MVLDVVKIQDTEKGDKCVANDLNGTEKKREFAVPE
jgi:hypothetical protein